MVTMNSLWCRAAVERLSYEWKEAPSYRVRELGSPFTWRFQRVRLDEQKVYRQFFSNLTPLKRACCGITTTRSRGNISCVTGRFVITVSTGASSVGDAGNLRFGTFGEIVSAQPTWHWVGGRRSFAPLTAEN
ncbi:hypothetical protein FOZ63_007260, partial [Perkinsus olseni]